MRFGLVLVVLTVLLLGPGARAEEGEYRTVVRTRAVEVLRPDDDPAGFSSVLRIKDPAPGTGLAEILDRVPGLRVREAGPGGWQGLSVRGADSHQVQVILDGVPLSSPASCGVDLSLVDPGHLEQVEVRRGGGSARFGTDALGGVVVLSTPQLRTRARTKLSVGYGSWNALAARFSRSAALRSPRLRYLVSASYRQSDGDFPYVDDNGQQRVRLNNDSRAGEALLKLDHLTGGWQLGLMDDFSLGERGAPGMSNQLPTAARQQDLRNVTALRALRTDLWVAGGALELMAYHRYTRFDFDEPTPPVVASHQQAFAPGARGRLALPLGRSGRLEGGVDLRGTWLRDAETDNPSRLDADVWLTSQTALLDRHLVLVPAVRLATATGFGATVVPRFGLVLRPLRWTGRSWLEGLELAGNVGRSFRHPSFQELYVRLDGYAVHGNPDLAPEDALDLDGGVRWRLPLLALEAAYFRRWIGNLIIFAPVSSFVVRADNYPGAEAQGLEVAADLRPDDLWPSAALGLHLKLAYTLTRTRFGDPPMRLPGHPTHRLVTRLGWEWPPAARGAARSWGLALWSGATVESGMVLSRFDSSEEEGRVLLSAGGAVTWRWLTLSAEGRNLLDKRDAVDILGFPLPPARFFVSLAGRL